MPPHSAKTIGPTSQSASEKDEKIPIIGSLLMPQAPRGRGRRGARRRRRGEVSKVRVLVRSKQRRGERHPKTEAAP